MDQDHSVQTFMSDSESRDSDSDFSEEDNYDESDGSYTEQTEDEKEEEKLFNNLKQELFVSFIYT